MLRAQSTTPINPVGDERLPFFNGLCVLLLAYADEAGGGSADDEMSTEDDG